jgi:hydrogenase nickel incorporation protein HypA/HybF
MHELSLARDLLATVEEQLSSSDARVLRVHLSVGTASGIVSDSLRFAFDVLAKGTRAQGAELSILAVPARCSCVTCGIIFEFDGIIGSCPTCQRLGGVLLSGNEMVVRAIEVADV